MSMRIITRTIYGSHLQTANLLGLPFTIEPNTTLNEKFDVLPTVTPDADDFPTVGYFCIGNGGHKVETDSDGIPYTSPLNHRASDAALFNHLPFVLRELNNDITDAERERYALRKVVQYDGKDYIGYFLKRIDTSSVVGKMLKTELDADGEEVVTDFVPSNSNLNPLPPVLDDGASSTDSKYLTTSAVIEVDFTDFDVQELMKATRIIYGTFDHSAISEIGLCTGKDYDSSLGGVIMKEAIAVQVASYITGYFPVGYSNQGFTLQVEAGATEPLLIEKPPATGGSGT